MVPGNTLWPQGPRLWLEVQEALPIRVSRTLRPHLFVRLKNAKEGGWLPKEAVTLQKSSSPFLASLNILSNLEGP